MTDSARTFPQMAAIIEPATCGSAVVVHYEVSEFDAAMASMRGMYTEPGKVAILRVNGVTMMSDTEHERRSNREFAWKAQGHVLVAGLGLGMILHPILKNPKVLSVTVIEKYQDVIDLIVPTLPQQDKLTVICADIFNWTPPKGDKWETIYFDIWSDICEDNLEQIAKLHQRFKTRKVAGGWMNSWCAEELRDRRRRA